MLELPILKLKTHKMKKENINKGFKSIRHHTNFNTIVLLIAMLFFLSINKCFPQSFMDRVPSYKKNNFCYTGVLKSYMSNDTDKIKQDKKNILTKDTIKKIEKEKTAKNSLTMQPFGFLLLLSNIEYDRYISKDFSTGLKIQFTTFWLRKAVENILESKKENKKDFEKTKIILNSFTSWGIGSHFRYYTGGRSVEGFYLGFNVDVSFISFDEQKDDDENYNPIFPPPPPSSLVPVIEHRKGTLWRTQVEIGDKIKLSGGSYGVVIEWSFGAGGAYAIYDHKVTVIPVIGLGLGVGYAF